MFVGVKHFLLLLSSLWSLFPAWQWVCAHKPKQHLGLPQSHSYLVAPTASSLKSPAKSHPHLTCDLLVLLLPLSPWVSCTLSQWQSRCWRWPHLAGLSSRRWVAQPVLSASADVWQTDEEVSGTSPCVSFAFLFFFFCPPQSCQAFCLQYFKTRLPTASGAGKMLTCHHAKTSSLNLISPWLQTAQLCSLLSIKLNWALNNRQLMFLHQTLLHLIPG